MRPRVEVINLQHMAGGGWIALPAGANIMSHGWDAERGAIVVITTGGRICVLRHTRDEARRDARAMRFGVDVRHEYDV